MWPIGARLPRSNTGSDYLESKSQSQRFPSLTLPSEGSGIRNLKPLSYVPGITDSIPELLFDLITKVGH